MNRKLVLAIVVIVVCLVSGSFYFLSIAPSSGQIESLTLENPSVGTKGLLPGETYIFRVVVYYPEGYEYVGNLVFKSSIGDVNVMYTWDSLEETFSTGIDTHNYLVLLSTSEDSSHDANRWYVNFRFRVSTSFPDDDLHSISIECRDLYGDIIAVRFFANMFYVQLSAIYSVTVQVEDQCGNTLEGATVNFGTTSTKTTDAQGRCSELFSSGETFNLHVSINIYGKTFEASESVSVHNDKTVTVTVSRTFRWDFYVTYVNGSEADGTLTLTGETHTEELPIQKGTGRIWLKNEIYQVSFEASPSLDLGQLTVENDGEQTFRINPETGGYTTSTEAPETEQTTLFPGVPNLLIFIMVTIIVAAIVVAVIIRAGSIRK